MKRFAPLALLFAMVFGAGHKGLNPTGPGISGSPWTRPPSFRTWAIAWASPTPAAPTPPAPSGVFR